MSMIQLITWFFSGKDMSKNKIQASSTSITISRTGTDSNKGNSSWISLTHYSTAVKLVGSVNIVQANQTRVQARTRII